MFKKRILEKVFAVIDSDITRLRAIQDLKSTHPFDQHRISRCQHQINALSDLKTHVINEFINKPKTKFLWIKKM